MDTQYGRYHTFLDEKRQGSCRSLTGNVLLVMLMVDDDESHWTDEAITKYKEAQKTATNKMISEAQQYGAKLRISILYRRCTITGSLSYSDTSDWSDAALAAAGLPRHSAVTEFLKRKYSTEEAAVLFCMNYPGRAFARYSNRPNRFECAFLYSDDADYRHELYHLFGAQDYYYPTLIAKYGVKYFPKSIMMTCGNTVTDSLTAYLLGWTPRLSDEARSFLDDTVWITDEALSKAAKEEMTRAYGTIRYGEATYTGEMKDGLPHGKGKLVWDKGTVYEGDFENGIACGQGTIRWSNGAHYVGSVKNWAMDGHGTYTYPNGTTQTGRWRESNFLGR